MRPHRGGHLDLNLARRCLAHRRLIGRVELAAEGGDIVQRGRAILVCGSGEGVRGAGVGGWCRPLHAGSAPHAGLRGQRQAARLGKHKGAGSGVRRILPTPHARIRSGYTGVGWPQRGPQRGRPAPVSLSSRMSSRLLEGMARKEKRRMSCSPASAAEEPSSSCCTTASAFSPLQPHAVDRKVPGVLSMESVETSWAGQRACDRCRAAARLSTA